ncbi:MULTISPECIES: hypothetical protein [unclassified Vibrio]|uniref:hypothetical protein n=1 Tax=unclassified Vibrio TaxID=2614977 RepID=UPI0012E9166A|nr:MULTISPECIES: hypothetical protein [unclassified Vibrio]
MAKRRQRNNSLKYHNTKMKNKVIPFYNNDNDTWYDTDLREKAINSPASNNVQARKDNSSKSKVRNEIIEKPENTQCSTRAINKVKKITLLDKKVIIKKKKDNELKYSGILDSRNIERLKLIREIFK